MTVLYFSRDYTTHDLRFLVSIAKEVNSVYFLRLENDGNNYVKNRLPENIKVIDWAGGKKRIENLSELLSLQQELQNVIEYVKPDVIHVGPILTCGYLIARIDFHPFVLMSWGYDLLRDSYTDKESTEIASYTLNKADYFLSDSTIVTQRAQQLGLMCNFAEFPWGIALENFPSKHVNNERKIKSTLNWENNFVVLCLRSWEPVYGIDILLKSFKYALTHNSNLRLLLIGNGSLHKQVVSFINENNLNKYVYMPGRIDVNELPEYYQNADVYISCAHTDGTSLSLLEAMASGLPIIVTDIPSNREWITPANGYLVADNDWLGFGNSIIACANQNTADLIKSSKYNRRIVETRADWAKNSSKIVQIYQKLIMKAN